MSSLDRSMNKIGLGKSAAGATAGMAPGFMVALLSLTLGFALSTAIRTLPAIGADMLIRDLRVTPQGLAALVGVFPLAFAIGLLPVGAALDRYGVRPVAVVLVAIITVGAGLAAIAQGPAGMLLAQIVLGLGCSGVLVAPLTFASRSVGPTQFGLWSGLILALGNSGMLLSASPMAWLMEHAGWRAGYWAAACFGLLTLLLIWLLVPRETGRAANELMPARSLLGDARDTVALALSARLRWLSALAFTNFAAQIGLRGLWGGPWLMEAKGFSRLEAGNALLVFTVALVIGPLVVGMLDRRFGHTGPVCAVGHLMAAAIMVLMVAGGPSGLLSGVVGLPALPGWWDVLMLTLFGIVYGITTLLFPLASSAVEKSQTGQAMAAVNLVNFFGTAVLQTASGSVAERQGPGAAIEFLAAAIVIGAIVYLLSLRNRRGNANMSLST